MTQKNGKKNDRNGKAMHKASVGIPSHTKRAIAAVLLCVVGLFLTLAAFGAAGIAGIDAYRLFAYLLGAGYFLVPLLFFILAGSTLREETSGFTMVKMLASAIFIFAGLGFVSIVAGKGGLVGDAIAHPAILLFDIYAALILLGGLSLVSLLLLLEGNIPIAPFVGTGRTFWAGIMWLVHKLF